MHQNRILPRVAVYKWMKSGRTTGDTTQGETEFGARDTGFG